MQSPISLFNHHKHTNQSAVLDWPAVVKMVVTPRFFTGTFTDDQLQAHKQSLRCISASSCINKTRPTITAHNQMQYLRVDSDENEYTVESLRLALLKVGINTFAIHSSWRNKPEFNKLKCLIPLLAPLDCDTWQNVQERLTEALDTDPCMDNRTQISYEPATYTGAQYLSHIEQQGAHNFELLPLLKPKPVMAPRVVVDHEGGSIIDACNNGFPWEYHLQCEGYKKKGRKWLSPESSSGIAGGRVFVGDDGKEYFQTRNASDPIALSGLGCVDGFGFLSIRQGKSQIDLCRELGESDFKDVTKQNQIDFAKKLDEPQPFSGEDFNAFAASFTMDNFNKQSDNPPPTNSFFGNITAPVDGHFDMQGPLGEEKTEKEIHVAKVLSTPQYKQELDHSHDDTSHIFPTPVDETIDIHNAPGVVGLCIEYINRMGRKPRKTLAVSCALSAVGMIGGLSHYDKAHKSTSNLFCFNIAGSGTGKEAILQAAGDLIDSSGLGACVMGKIKSEQELYRNLITSQSTYYNIDEIGEVLGKITASKESYHSGIIGSLMSLYSKGLGKMKLGGDEIKDIKEVTKKRLDKLDKLISEAVEKDKQPFFLQEFNKLKIFYELLEQNILLNPFLSISGCTTPEVFGEIATRKNVLSGFIGRSLMFREHDDAPRSHRIFNPYKEVPINLAHELKQIKNGGNQEYVEIGRIETNGEKLDISTTAEGNKWLESFVYNVETQARESAATDGLSAVFNRQIELVLKVSLILAIGDGKVRTLAHLKWAQSLVAGDIKTKLDLVRGNDDESESQQDRLENLTSKILDQLEKSGDQTEGRLINRIRGLDIVTCTNLTNLLMISGKVEKIEGVGRKKAKFKLIT